MQEYIGKKLGKIIIMENLIYKIDNNSILNYYEIKNTKPKLLLLHAQICLMN